MKFLRNIHKYNCMFAFTSMGATIDHSLNASGGPKVFKISGQVSHRIGSLLPNAPDSPEPMENISIRIIGRSDDDGPQFNLPTSSGLAALIVGDRTVETSARDIIICSRLKGLQFIS